MNKYKSISARFTTINHAASSGRVNDKATFGYKSPSLVKVGQRLFFIKTKEVACFIAENKIIFLADGEGKRFVVNDTLEKLETILDLRDSFRND